MASTQLARIGFDHVVGAMRGLVAWRVAGQSVTTSGTASVTELFARRDDPGLQVLDVRSPAERDQHAMPGSIHRYLPDLVDDPSPSSTPPGPCG